MCITQQNLYFNVYVYNQFVTYRCYKYINDNTICYI